MQDKEHKYVNIDRFVLDSAAWPGTIQSVILVEATERAFVELFKVIGRPSKHALDAKTKGSALLSNKASSIESSRPFPDQTRSEPRSDIRQLAPI